MEPITAFTAVTAVAVLLQTAILAALYFSVKKTNEKLTRSVEDMRRQVEPILGRVQSLLDDLQPRVSAMVANATEVTELARGQAYKVDRVFTEAVDRLRIQVLRADQMLSGFLETIEQAGTEMKSTVWEPVRQATAMLKGVKAGLEFFKGQKRESSARSRGAGEEELFI